MVKRSVAERRRYLEMFRASGESIVGFCRSQGINDKTFGNWLREERLGMTLGEYRKLRRSQGRVKPIKKSQRKPEAASTAPIISPVAIVPSEEFPQVATSTPLLTLHLPSGVRAELTNIATPQIGELIQSLLRTDSNSTSSDSLCSH